MNLEVFFGGALKMCLAHIVFSLLISKYLLLMVYYIDEPIVINLRSGFGNDF